MEKAEVHFFHSGDGDTVLIRGGNEWGMVDSNFDSRGHVRARVERVLKDVPRLRFVCITHFDLDHIRGMGRFLRERFSEEDGHGDRIWHVDQVILPVSQTSLEVIDILRRYEEKKGASPVLEGDLSKEAQKLLETLCEMVGFLPEHPGRRSRVRKRRPEFLCLTPGQDLRSRKDSEETTFGIGPWRCVCLGPQQETTNELAVLVNDFFGGNRRLREVYRGFEMNAVSRVLALRHEQTGFAVLLTGDSTPGELRAAVREWKAMHKAWGSEAPEFGTVKVSHHGAESCHVLEVYQSHCSRGYSRGVITAEDLGDHPHPKVIADLVGLGIDYRVTGQPATRSFRGVPFGVSAAASEDIVLGIADGTHRYSPGGRLSRNHPSSLPLP